MKRLLIVLTTLLCAHLLVSCSLSAGTLNELPSSQISSLQESTPDLIPTNLPTEHDNKTTQIQGNSSSPLIEIPYTIENPLTDSKTIIEILDDLRKRQEIWFSQPGWYQKTACNHNTTESNHWMECIYFLVHVLDEAHTCREQMVYFIVNNQVMPFQIMLENGATAGFNVPAGIFNVDGVRPPDPTVQCSLESLVSVSVWGESLLTNERAWFEAFEADLNTGGGSQEEGSGATAGTTSAWLEQGGEKDYLVLAYEIKTFRDPQPVFFDPDTGQSQIIEHSKRLKGFDLNTGLPHSEQEILYLQNGQIGGDEWVSNFQYIYYEVLPTELLLVYQDTVNRVLIELGR